MARNKYASVSLIIIMSYLPRPGPDKKGLVKKAIGFVHGEYIKFLINDKMM